MGRAWLLGLGVALVGCVQPLATETCDDGSVCPEGQQCQPGGGCVAPEALAACAGLADGAACTLPGVGLGVCTDALCTIVVGGDGVVGGDEVCDDGNRVDGDGCSALCTSDETCGNGVRDLLEECDDGNRASGDGCQADCRRPACGDGVLDPMEGCDDGGVVDGDGCTARCTLEACGNGIRDLLEECDDGNLVDGDGCQATCRLPTCGDGVIDPTEACDDGNRVAADGCNASCASDETCGNGVVDPQVGEQCDDGNLMDADGCQASCQLPACGDAIVDPAEVCDDGNTVSGDGCNATCISDESCGNGVVDLGELCDDGNLQSGDACQPTCLPPRCGDALLDPGEICDDGNNTPGDGCTFDCSSDETCGNGVTDFFAGESCDDYANGQLHDHCTDACVVEQPRWVEAVAPAAPSPRSAHAMAYDPVRREIVLFGGQHGTRLGEFDNGQGTLQALDDTWALSLSTGTWSRRASSGGPGARFGHALAYDVARRKLILFGGQAPIMPSGSGSSSGSGSGACGLAGSGSGGQAVDCHEVMGDTWEYDPELDTWTLRAPYSYGQTPNPRTFAAMAYDTVRRRIVLFGGGVPSGSGGAGSVAAATYDDTWEFDGEAGTWTHPLPATYPPIRIQHAMAFDVSRGVTVLHGGLDASAAWLGDTWEWNGTSWNQREDAPAQQVRGHALSYDPIQRRIMRFGGTLPGSSIGTRTSATWSWNGTTGVWTQVAASGPSGRQFTALAHDPIGQRAYLFGGQASGAVDQADTWSWDATQWTDRSVPAHPVARRAASMAFDAARGELVLFGGDAGGPDARTPLSGTWTWDGSAWAARTSPLSPSARTEAAMAYDGRRERVVLFGGSTAFYSGGGVAYDRQTWEWDGSTWALRSSVGPSARAGHGLAYDAARDRTVLVGGRTGPTEVSGETWEWNGTAWSLRAPSGPGPIAYHAMAYDAARERTVVVGGWQPSSGDGNWFDDTWEWDGTAWTSRPAPPGAALSPRRGSVLAFDPAAGELLLIGGELQGGAPVAELRVWDDAASVWMPRSTLDTPPARSRAAAAFDGRRHQAILFGGDAGIVGVLDDVWRHEVVFTGLPLLVDDACTGLSDLDGDGLIGCEDPDCWSVCAPACAPGYACPAGAPACGDGACAVPRETAWTCPADCDPQPPVCGDGACGLTESVVSCGLDCARCGDLLCSPGETAGACPSDC
ncbi:MAG: DUF4215 domain-containing protein [Kofleriaceae bacterium]